MRTGELAANAGVNIQTVRFYERRGILPMPSRTASGYRFYSAEAVRVIRFIKRAQELGFTLDEIEALLRLRNNRRSSCAVVKSAGKAKMAAVEAKIADLKAMKRALGSSSPAASATTATASAPSWKLSSVHLTDRWRRRLDPLPGTWPRLPRSW